MSDSFLSPEEISALVSQLNQEDALEDNLISSEKVRECREKKQDSKNAEPESCAETKSVVFAPIKSNQSAKEFSTMEEFSNLNFSLEIVLGEITLTVGELLNLDNGSVIVLDLLAGENSTLILNDKPLAEGEVVVLNDCFAMRINDIAGGGSSKEDQGHRKEEEK
ncbi:FliM/FliN family flagellar motor switch protein [Candidatus Contubernalis alkaliaceticus]|uniref:FliM/FliN family flagellar motor switch protein n=1 Tax=Candidatus Contubernalis alkaliaceticus TaxID=338645 RepID=UPI001F4C2F2D|nr:FliM/FliN family flagellar motor C-terminal domain-containing protein [Candidatus Contubernalis alkalaceticus]UNC91755.1 FliM/FliN family flagellar motor switch protein [Candidatus Contubernalis alkalaceticus]